MTNQAFENHVIQSHLTIRQAMKKFDQSRRNTLFVIKEDQVLFGVLTDGDIRRCILSGKSLNVKIEIVCNRNPISTTLGYDTESIKQIMLEKYIQAIPVLDEENRILDVLFWDAVFGDDLHPLASSSLVAPVVIMAGGKGTRLEPFTKVLPKPLIPIHDKPIIEHIIERFTSKGCTQFYMTVNYKGKILKAFFEELNPEYEVTFIDEETPLGTAGSLGLLPDTFDTPIFVTNCDTIINIDYGDAYDFHNEEANDITLIAAAKEYIIPYGTCELNSEGHLSHINEKPKFDFLISTGLYILNPEMLGIIPKNEVFHITDLIKVAKDQGKKVGVFPIDEDAWIDVGQWTEYKKVMDKL